MEKPLGWVMALMVLCLWASQKVLAGQGCVQGTQMSESLMAAAKLSWEAICPCSPSFWQPLPRLSRSCLQNAQEGGAGARAMIQASFLEAQPSSMPWILAAGHAHCSFERRRPASRPPKMTVGLCKRNRKPSNRAREVPAPIAMGNGVLDSVGPSCLARQGFSCRHQLMQAIFSPCAARAALFG